MRASYAVAFLFFFVFSLPGASAQDLCTDPRYAAGGFDLNRTDICHNETVTIINANAVEDAKYYYNYQGESYEEIRAMGGTALDFSTVTKPGLFRVIQVGKVDGKEAVACREIKVRNSNTAVFSYNFCPSAISRLEVIIPNHPLNEQYSGYRIELNGIAHLVGTTPTPIPFPVGNVSNTLRVIGLGGIKTCNSEPLTTTVSPFHATGKNFDYYPEIKELKVLDDNRGSVQLRIQGQYLESYNLYRYEAGQPSTSATIVTNKLKADTIEHDTPPTSNKPYCYYIQPTIAGNCGLFPLRSADICSVPLTSPVPPTTVTNHLSWKTERLSSYHRAELQRITDGTADHPKDVTSSSVYQDDHGDCSKKICYRIKVSYTSTNNGVNFSGTSLSNQLCFDHREELTDYPKDAYVTTEQEKNLIYFSADTDSPYRPDRWEVFRHNGTDYTLLETVPAGPVNPVATDHDAPVTRSEKYKVRYIDECENTSELSPEMNSLFLTHDDNNVLHWNSGSPFADAQIRQYEVIYYEGEDLSRTLGTQPAGAAQNAHSLNSASFTNMGSFRLRAIGSDGTESLSNVITFAVKGSLFLPTAFSPNDDDKNDVFKAKGNIGGIRNFHMEIFSPSGQKIADITDPIQGWDGRLPNGNKALFGNYLYTLKAEMTNGQEIHKNGSFVLLY